MALPKPLEDAFQEMERRGREASEKIDEAVKAIDESEDDDGMDFNDPSLVRHVDDLRRTSARMKSITSVPEPVDFEATPLEVPTPPATSRAPSVPGRRLVRPPRRSPTQ